MEVHPQQRCYRAGGATRELNCSVDAAISAKDISALKGALYTISRLGREAGFVIPEGKKLANTIAFRGRMLYGLADDLGEKKVKAHQGFFSQQLHSLRAYTFELERQSYNSCIDKVYEEKKLDKLPSVPKRVRDDAQKEKDRRAAEDRKRHATWAR